jgi:hypothetical protein
MIDGWKHLIMRSAAAMEVGANPVAYAESLVHMVSRRGDT